MSLILEENIVINFVPNSISSYITELLISYVYSAVFSIFGLQFLVSMYVR